MNEINALTLTNDNLVVFLFPCMANETISGCRGVAFSLCTKVWRNEAKQCFVYFAKRQFPKRYFAFFVFVCFHIT